LAVGKQPGISRVRHGFDIFKGWVRHVDEPRARHAAGGISGAVRGAIRASSFPLPSGLLAENAWVTGFLERGAPARGCWGDVHVFQSTVSQTLMAGPGLHVPDINGKEQYLRPSVFGAQEVSG